MNKKPLIYVGIFITLIIIMLKGWDWKVNHDMEQAHFATQKERVTLYMKYNVKNYKSITFTDTSINPMGSYVIEGYINGDKDISFVAEATSASNFEFVGDMSYTEEMSNAFKKDEKSMEEIEQEIEQKDNKKFGLQ